MPRLHVVDSSTPPMKLERRLAVKVVAWIVGSIAVGLLLASLLVIASRLDTVSARLQDKTTAEDLARTRYDSEMRELHEVKVGLNYIRALYDEDLRRGIVIIHDKKEER